MNESLPIIFFAGTAVAAWALGWLIHPLLKSWGLVDVPNARSSHTRVTLRGGGLAIVFSIWLAAGWLAFQQRTTEMLWLFAASAPVSLVSLWDDVKSLSVKIRLAVHLAAAITVVFLLRPFVTEPPLSIFLTLGIFVFWMVAYTNAFNFMDGINGMAAFQGITTGIGTALIAAIASGNWTDWTVLAPLIVAGAAAGFLPHNFPSARMFMGDVGSVTMGFLLSGLLLWVAVKHGLWLIPALLLLHANFILDTAVTRVRLMLRGGQWYGAHRDHYYQRLTRAGKSHPFVSSLYAAVQSLTICAAIFYVRSDAIHLRLAAFALVLCLWSAVFWYSELKFKSMQPAQP